MTPLSRHDTIIVSDWHLGFPGTQAKRINAFLDELMLQPPLHKIILNGDIFDLNWDRLEKIVSKYLDTIKRIIKLNQRGTSIIYTLGNHDPLTNKQRSYLYSIFNKIGLNNIRILPAYQIKRHDRVYLVTHGHMFDTFIAEHKTLANWSDIGYRITIAIDNFLGIGVTEIFFRLIRKITKWSVTYENRCRRYLRKRKYHALLLGHTHEPKIISWLMKKNGRTKLAAKLKNYLQLEQNRKPTVEKFFYNSGDWVEPNHCTYLRIDQTGNTDLHYFSKS